jgi:hypothetical protein
MSPFSSLHDKNPFRKRGWDSWGLELYIYIPKHIIVTVSRTIRDLWKFGQGTQGG